MPSNLRVGILQVDPLIGDVSGNADRIAREYGRVLDADPDLVVTPELSLVGYPPRDLLHRPGVLDAQEAALDSLAARTRDGPPLVVGAALRTGRETGPPLYNAVVLLREGKRVATSHKRLLPTYDVFDEHRYFRPGTEPTLVTVDGVEVGLTVCEDAWHDAVVTGKRRHGRDPLQETAARGADVVLTLSASPFSLDKPARRERRFLDHAARTDCPVAFANQVGGHDELVFDGHSFVAAGGAVLDRLAGFEPDTAIVDVPVGRERSDSIPGYDRDPGSQARAALRLGVRDYFAKTGFDEAVVGLSGGIDSSVAAALATNLGIAFDVVPVGDAVETVHRTLDEHAEPLTDIAAENIQARIRGDVLMGLANQRDALVLTPDNKSEAAVGYCTLYGDTVGALAPLGDCYKRLVYELASAFNDSSPPSARSSTVVPKSVVEKAPTAELREGQTDEEELPPYGQLDPVLEGYIEGNRRGSELRERHPDSVVDDALARVTGAEFKRRQTPPPLRITRKALGRGWNYPVAAEYGHVTGRDGQ
jgi:NAD+ synthase (glutamine-hydrolysing)